MKNIGLPLFISLLKWAIVTTLLVAVMLAAWLAIAKIVAVQQSNRIEREIEAFVSQFPPTDFNHTANQIRWKNSAKDKPIAAIEMLEVSWKLTDNLHKHPFFSGFRVILKSEYLTATIRKLDAINSVWHQRLSEQNYRDYALTLIKAQTGKNFYILNGINRSDGFPILKEMGMALPEPMALLARLNL